MWDWIAYSGLWIAAAIIAINGRPCCRSYIAQKNSRLAAIKSLELRPNYVIGVKSPRFLLELKSSNRGRRYVYANVGLYWPIQF